MISAIRGKLVKRLDDKIVVDTGGIWYEIYTSKLMSLKLDKDINKDISVIIYQYLQMDQNKAIPIMIGFSDELEKDFFEVFISVSGIGPKAALRAFDKPVTLIARAVEKGDLNFLKSLAGIGKQKAKRIIAHLQGKVGRFALIKEEQVSHPSKAGEIVEEARKILKRLQYNSKETEEMIKKALQSSRSIDNVESLLNEIYKSRAL